MRLSGRDGDSGALHLRRGSCLGPLHKRSPRRLPRMPVSSGNWLHCTDGGISK